MRPLTGTNAGEKVIVGATTPDVVTAADVLVTTDDVVAAVTTAAADELAEPELDVEHPQHAVSRAVATAT